MAKLTVSLPQGTRDFGPETLRKRQYIINTIRTVFELYGFQPLETPAMENLETLLGKYGDEGNKLIFRILNNGLDQPGKRQQALADFEKLLDGKNVPGITERALKYDLTIPFARYVAMNQGQLIFPFKRYQIQPVWRADRPAKGRYREFFQCDADIVGSNSLLNELELANLYADVFKRLNLRIDIRINSRQILAALAEICGGTDKLTDITVAVDKLDKIGPEKVNAELRDRGLDSDQIASIGKYLAIEGSNSEKLERVKLLLGSSENARRGIGELSYLLETDEELPLTVDLSLARGLNYYTGTIFEVRARDFSIGSIGGGGRYDDLTGLFGVPGIPGVGISFGLDRIYDVMEGLDLFPPSIQTGSRVLFFNLGNGESRAAYRLLQALRENNVPAEIYPESVKFDRQFKYARKKHIPYVVIIGSDELRDKECQVKDLRSGEQKKVAWDDLPNYTFHL